MADGPVPSIPPRNLQTNKPNITANNQTDVERRIEKTSEIDPDEQRRRFREMVEKPKSSPVEEPKTPFDLFKSSNHASNHRSKKVSAAPPPSPMMQPTSDASLQSSLNQTAVPNVSYSPAPSTSLAGTSSPDNYNTSPLPQSQTIWNNLDEPPAMPLQAPVFEETAASSSRSYNESTDQQDDQGSTQTTAGENPNVPVKKKPTTSVANAKASKIATTHKTGTVSDSKPELESQAASTERPSQNIPAGSTSAAQSGGVPPQHKKQTTDQTNAANAAIPAAPANAGTGASQQDTNEKKSQTSSPARSTKDVSGAPTPIEDNEAGPEGAPMFSEEEPGEKDDNKKPSQGSASAAQMTAPTTSTFPSEAMPVAQAATTAAAPYLAPETLSMYFHMVGTIVGMATPSGDSKTEFVLNAASFANSKFYGSTISIEKFATAPYAFNILLTGSKEAVDAFNQYIPNLRAAFEKGNFAFEINRIDTSYERPLFRRKDSSKDRDSSKDKGSEKDRQKGN